MNKIDFIFNAIFVILLACWAYFDDVNWYLVAILILIKNEQQTKEWLLRKSKQN